MTSSCSDYLYRLYRLNARQKSVGLTECDRALHRARQMLTMRARRSLQRNRLYSSRELIATLPRRRRCHSSVDRSADSLAVRTKFTTDHRPTGHACHPRLCVCVWSTEIARTPTTLDRRPVTDGRRRRENGRIMRR